MRLLLFVSVALLVGCGAVSGADVSAVSALTGDATSGQTLYTNNCERCHGADGASGTARRDIAAVAKSSADKAISVVLSGEDEMPSFASSLTSQQIADIVAYLKTP